MILSFYRLRDYRTHIRHARIELFAIITLCALVAEMVHHRGRQSTTAAAYRLPRARRALERSGGSGFTTLFARYDKSGTRVLHSENIADYAINGTVS